MSHNGHALHILAKVQIGSLARQQCRSIQSSTAWMALQISDEYDAGVDVVYKMSIPELEHGSRRKVCQNSFKVPLGFPKHFTRDLPLELLTSCISALHIRADTLLKVSRF